MSKWCDTCYKEPYQSCDESCPVFGLRLDGLAKKYFEKIEEANYIFDGEKYCAEELISRLCDYGKIFIKYTGDNNYNVTL